MLSRIVCVAIMAIIALSTVDCANRINVNFANLLADADVPLPSTDDQTVVLPDPSSDGVAINFAYMMNGVDCQPKDTTSCTVENAYNFTQIDDDPYVLTMPGLCRWSAEPGRRAACVRPRGNLDIVIEVINSGVGKWLKNEITLQLGGENSFTYPYWKLSTLHLEHDTPAGAVAKFHGVIKAPAAVGVFELHWQGVGPCGRFGNISGIVEVTCSDGIFCNGMERWVGNKCKKSVYDQCDDFSDCTIDTCDEVHQNCSHKMDPQQPHCATCDSGAPCTPDCNGKECGSDGCGGQCGGGCSSTTACSSEFQCVTPTSVGSCSNPIPLVAQGESLLGRHLLQYDNKEGVDEVTPTCNSKSTASELVFVFTVPAGKSYGIDVRMHNITEERDTLMEIRKNTCQDKAPGEAPLDGSGPGQNVWCADDSTPPGHYGSRIAAQLTEGTYYLIADGYSIEETGWFTLDVRVVEQCVPNCMARFCGDDGCGGDCGPCGEEEVCSIRKRCIPAVCDEATRCLIFTEEGNTTTSYERECGYDSCDRGGVCGDNNGSCLDGKFCVQDTGKCEEMPVCNHLVPTCSNCNSTQFCGSDCHCHTLEDRWADIIVDREALIESILFDEQEFDEFSCVVAEGCIEGTGLRRLMKFSTVVVNIGNANLDMPAPAERPDEFHWATCHNHYHYNNFAQYRLLALNGTTIRKGHKQAYCLVDSFTHPSEIGPSVPCSIAHACENPGINKGWFDVYGNDLDCQWIDITGVESGRYILRIDANNARQLQESTYENNSVEIYVTIGDTNETNDSHAGPGNEVAITAADH